MGPTLFLDLGNFSDGGNGKSDPANTLAVLNLYRVVRERSGVFMGVNPGPLDNWERIEKGVGDASEMVFEDIGDGVRGRRVEIDGFSVKVVGLIAGDQDQAAMARIGEKLGMVVDDVRIGVVAGGTGQAAEPVARQLFEETAADFVFWTENGLGFTEDQQGRCLAAPAETGSLVEIRIENGRSTVSRTILETGRFRDPVVDRLISGMYLGGGLNVGPEGGRPNR